jgi:hypothetical protein
VPPVRFAIYDGRATVIYRKVERKRGEVKIFGENHQKLQRVGEGKTKSKKRYEPP